VVLDVVGSNPTSRPIVRSGYRIDALPPLHRESAGTIRENATLPLYDTTSARHRFGSASLLTASWSLAMNVS
jgi:hypothetical protein